MAPDTTSTSRPKSRPALMSPMRLIWKFSTYDRWYPKEEDNRQRLRNRSRDVDVELKGSDARGFLYGQKLQPHTLIEMDLHDEHVFPRCLGKYRSPHFDEELWPQYGDLKDPKFFRGKHLKKCNLLRDRRAELIHRVTGYDINIESPEESKEETELGTLKEPETGDALDNELAEAMRAQLRIVEEKKKAARQERRLKRKNSAEARSPESQR
jgi:hypothetical protein